jgi:hypothetical protein
MEDGERRDRLEREGEQGFPPGDSGVSIRWHGHWRWPLAPATLTGPGFGMKIRVCGLDHGISPFFSHVSAWAYFNVIESELILA